MSLSDEFAQPIRLTTYLGTSFNQTSYESVYENAVTAFKVDDQSFKFCGEMQVSLETDLTNISLNKNEQTLTIESSEDTQAGSLGPAGLVFTRNGLSVKVPIEAIIRECQVEKLTWKLPGISILYEIGSGITEEAVPETIQEPDCGLTWSSMQLVLLSEDGTGAKSVTLSEDFATLKVEASDFSLQGKSLSFALKIDDEAILDQKELSVTVKFSAIPFEFDKSVLQVSPLTCGPEDAEWELTIPPLIGPSE